MNKTITISGSMAQQPAKGGLTWFFLQYILGFRRLGWDVLFVDRLDAAMCTDARGATSSLEDSFNLRRFLKTIKRFNLDCSFSLIYNHGEQIIGLSRAEVLERARNSAFLLNIMGFLDDAEILAAVPRRVFLDIDPGFAQMWRELKLHDAFIGYDDFVTVGQNLGKPDCTIPPCGLNWLTTPHPVVLEHWPATPKQREAFTSIGAWRGANAPLDFQGTTYGLRVHEFRQFASLPKRCDAEFEMALDIHPAEIDDLKLLQSNGWSLVDPRNVAGSLSDYRTYIADSMAEFMIPKQMYVRSNSGLLSDRSVYYLASGKPVLARDTGLGGLYPTERGLLTFSTMDEAIDGVQEILGNYDRHTRAARTLAEEFFDSDKVLRELLIKLGIE